MGKPVQVLFDSMDSRDLIEIAILAVGIYAVLRFLRRTRGAGIVRGLGIVFCGFFLVAQLLIARFDLTELGKVLDYILATTVFGLLVIFQPELRRGLMLLGQYRGLQFLGVADELPSISKSLTDTALALSKDRVGGLIAVQREQSLQPYIETGERIDSELSIPLLRTIFHDQTPLHDGAVIVQRGRIIAAACQLPLGNPPVGLRTGMRHRAAIGLSDETDALLLIVSEESGRISLAIHGQLEIVPRDQLAKRLAEELDTPSAPAESKQSYWNRILRVGRKSVTPLS